MIMFVPQPTSRIRYMAQWLGMQLTGAPLTLVTSLEGLNGQEPVLNYSSNPLPFPAFHLVPHGLLSRSGTHPVPVEEVEREGMPVFFTTTGGHFPFDILAAAFYLISRYEEYDQSSETDIYGRYAHTNSLAFRHGFLKRPLVDEWVEWFRQRLSAFFPEQKWQQPEFQWRPTYDVDVAWHYRHKGWLRQMAMAGRHIWRGAWSALRMQAQVLSGSHRDPSDVFSDLEALHRQCGVRPIWFFLLAGRYRGFDRNISPRSKALRHLMVQLQQFGTVAIHFSWAASRHQSLMQSEQAQFRRITGSGAQHNRMHFLRWQVPDTFNRLLQLDPPVLHDYSMGYGTINGFRASTARPYVWYDLRQEQATPLCIYPFACMDANNIFEQKDDPDAAFEEWTGMLKTVKATGGHFITVCHNHLLGLDTRGRAWWDMYMRFVQHVQGK